MTTDLIIEGLSLIAVERLKSSVSLILNRMKVDFLKKSMIRLNSNVKVFLVFET